MRLAPVNSGTLVFLTNNFELDAIVVAKAYKARWQIELFFKWIKQNRRIKSFYGTSENAVKTQKWIAVNAYLLVVIFNKTTGMSQNLSRMSQVLSVNIFSKDPIHQLFTKNDTRKSSIDNPNQMISNGIELDSSGFVYSFWLIPIG